MKNDCAARKSTPETRRVAQSQVPARYCVGKEQSPREDGQFFFSLMVSWYKLLSVVNITQPRPQGWETKCVCYLTSLQ